MAQERSHRSEPHYFVAGLVMITVLVVGALVSLLAVFLGLESRGESKLAIVAKVQINGLRIGTFGLAAVAGVLLGQWVRVNNPIAQPPQQQLARWQQAFPDNPVLAAQLMGFTHWRTMLREVLPGALATVFALCLTSFAVALILGGGPWATTLELAIYQAVRFDFDLGHAAGLALVQAKRSSA